MLRRNTRLRREYLYRKSLEGKEKETYERKRKIREALRDGKSIPTELRDEEAELRREIEYEDEVTREVRPRIDDEYARAGMRDPKILITTSRDPSSRLMQFVKELRLVFPNSERINRGHYVLTDIVRACRANEVTDLIIAHEHRGEPDGLIISHFPYGPTAYFSLINCVMRHDIKDHGTVAQAYPHLVFDNMKTQLGERVTTILKYLFPVPKDESQRVISFVNRDDFISFRHHTYDKDGKEVVLKELGPRFEMKPYQIKLGTLDTPEADNEWVNRPFKSTAWKKQAL